MALGNKEVMAKNIRLQMEKKGINQTELCSILGFKPMTVSDWLNAKTYPRIEKIEKMAEFFGIQKSDLVEEQSEIGIMKSSSSYSLTPDESSLVDDYRSLNDTGKQKAREQISDLKEIPRYTSGVRFMGQLTPYNGSVSPDLLPNAAHERTDIAIDPADREADEELLARLEKEGK